MNNKRKIVWVCLGTSLLVLLLIGVSVTSIFLGEGHFVFPISQLKQNI